MILVASDDQKSFDSIDQWRDLIRKMYAKEPIQLVLVSKSDDARDHKVTESMLDEKSRLDDQLMDGAIVLDAKNMEHEQYC